MNTSSARAWEWIGCTKADLGAIPRLSAALKNVVGSKSEIIDALRKSEAPEARKILEVIDSCQVPGYIEYLPLEAFCFVTKVPTKKFFSIVAEVLFEESQNEALLIVNQGIPQIAQATVKQALKAKGTKEKQMLLQHAKIAPVPKGSVVQIFNPQIDQSTKVQQVVMPPAEDSVKKMSERFNKNVSPPTALIEGDFEEIGEEG